MNRNYLLLELILCGYCRECCAGTGSWIQTPGQDETRRGWASGAFTTRSEKETGEIGAGEHFPRTEDSRGDELTDKDVII